MNNFIIFISVKQYLQSENYGKILLSSSYKLTIKWKKLYDWLQIDTKITTDNEHIL
jgi:hypothetical protein